MSFTATSSVLAVSVVDQPRNRPCTLVTILQAVALHEEEVPAKLWRRVSLEVKPGFPHVPPSVMTASQKHEANIQSELVSGNGTLARGSEDFLNTSSWTTFDSPGRIASTDRHTTSARLPESSKRCSRITYLTIFMVEYLF